MHQRGDHRRHGSAPVRTTPDAERRHCHHYALCVALAVLLEGRVGPLLLVRKAVEINKLFASVGKVVGAVVAQVVTRDLRGREPAAVS